MEPILSGVLHGLLLIALSWHAASRLTDGVVRRLCAAFLLVWGNLAYTAIALAVINKLGARLLYFAVSVAGAAAFSAILRFVCATPEFSKIEQGSPDRRRDRLLWRALGIPLALAALASALICYFYVPNNWDSCTYRFSRAFFYLAHGNLLHTGNPLDPRLLYYPFNGTLFYLFFATYHFPAGWMYLVTCLAWIFAGLGTYFVARRIGASRSGAFVAAWICWLTPNILAQPASTNDEVLAAVPLLLALAFVLEWCGSGRKRFALLAGIGLGLGMGAKLHWVFYSTFLLLGAIVLAVRIVRNATFRVEFARRIPAILLAGSIAAPLACAFLLANYLSSGKLADHDYNNAILNRPFRISLAKEKIRINTAELFLSPLPDLLPPVHREERAKDYAAFNRFFMKCCFSDLVETTKRSPEGYLFEGPADPDGAAPTEYTVWLGFMPHLLLAALVIGFLRKPFPNAVLWLAGAFFLWHATYAVQNRFIPTASVYFSFPAVLAMAALGPAWDFARATRTWPAKLLFAGFAGVFGTHVLLGADLLAFGGLRNLQFVWHGTPAPEMHAADPSVIDAIRDARRIYIPYTHWEVLYWNFMRFNPAATYTTGVDLRVPASDTMMLLSIAREGAADFVPARLPDGVDAGLTYLGKADGQQEIFAQGGHARRAGARYMLVPLSWFTDPSGRTTGFAPHIVRPSQLTKCCVGLEPGGDIEYRYELRSASRSTAVEWRRAGDPDPGIAARPGESYDSFVVDTRSRDNPAIVMRSVRKLNAGPYEVGKDETVITPH